MIMKKLVSMTMAMAMMAALFVACGDDGTDDETPPPLFRLSHWTAVTSTSRRRSRIRCRSRSA